MPVRSQGRPRPTARIRPSIRSRLAAILILPLASAAVLWVLAGSAVLGGAARRGAPALDQVMLIKIALLAGLGLLIVVSGFLTTRFVRLLSRDISDILAATRQFSDEQLPQLMSRLRHGDLSAAAGHALPRIRARTAEIARVAESMAALRQAAEDAAASEARLRTGLSDVFASLARRSQTLLQRQLGLIDELEQKADDPAALAELFQLDHLTTRLRRHAEGLIILSGAAAGRTWTDPVPVVDVTRAAIAEVEDYTRVALTTACQDAVAGPVVADVIHLLAELIENAALYSPPGTHVEVRAERLASGLAVEIEDRGLGIMTHELHVLNEQLASPPDFDLANADQLGLFVVGKLAARHRIQVALRRSPHGGTTASVLLPVGAVVPGTGAWLLSPAGITSDDPGPAAGRAMPRRIRQASLSAQLRDGPPITASPPIAGPSASPGAHTPEQARSLAAALQTGWQRGRNADTPGAEPAAETTPRGEA
jgi:signal transduction histidine kinase